MSKKEKKEERYLIEEPQKSCGGHCIKIQDFSVKYGNQLIIKDINLHIHCGKLTAIIGKNGAGKSTLIKAILDEVPHTGTIEFQYVGKHNCGTSGTSENKKNVGTKLTTGYVPQHLNIPKNTPTSVYDLFASFISNTPVFFRRSKKTAQMIQQQLAYFGADELIDQPVCDLSGGELQRVLLSIATTPIPNLLLLDEPVSGIDQNGMELFFNKLVDLKENHDLAAILVSHDLEYVAKYADYVVLLDKTIRKEGTPKEVFASKEFRDVFGNIAFMEGQNEYSI